MNMNRQHRLQWVDSLRGLAALGVVIMHLYQHLRKNYPDIAYYQSNSAPALFIEDFFNLGKIGVIVFFFISGFVIPFSLQNKNIRQFATTRFFRLYPAYWLSIALCLMVIGMPPAYQLLANLTMFQKFIGVADMIGVYWTLQIELIFYFVCGSLYYKGLLYREKIISNGFYLLLALSVLMAAARFFTGIKLPVAAPLGLTVMFGGIIFRKYSDAEGSFTGKQLGAYLFSFIGALLLVCFLAYNRNYGYDEKWYIYFVSYTTALIIFLVFAKFKWCNRFLVFLGAISYSLYLLHPVMGLALTDLLKENYFPGLSSGTYIFLCLLFSIAAATLCYYFVEKPAIAIGKKIYHRKSRWSLNIEKK